MTCPVVASAHRRAGQVARLARKVSRGALERDLGVRNLLVRPMLELFAAKARVDFEQHTPEAERARVHA